MTSGRDSVHPLTGQCLSHCSSHITLHVILGWVQGEMFRNVSRGEGGGGEPTRSESFLSDLLFIARKTLRHKSKSDSPRERRGGGTDRQTGTETEKREGTVESTRKIDIEKAELLKVDEAYNMY